MQKTHNFNKFMLGGALIAVALFTFGNKVNAQTATGTTAVATSTGLVVKISAPDSTGNLSIPFYQGTSITLSWKVSTSTYDNGAFYDIRYNTSPITEANFASSTQFTGGIIETASLSGVNGVNRMEIINGLSQDTTYYFALKSSFDKTNWSSLSDIPSFSISKGTKNNAEVPTMNLNLGKTDPQVGLLQKFLAVEGFYTGPVTNHFGNLTKAALIAFQTKNHIVQPSGNYGPITRAFMQKMFDGMK